MQNNRNGLIITQKFVPPKRLEYFGFYSYFDSVSGQFQQLFCRRKFTIVFFNSTHSLVEYMPGDAKMKNLKILRAIRVLRPLKLVSGVPSMFYNMIDITNNLRSKMLFHRSCLYCYRFTSGPIFNTESYGATFTNRLTGTLCHCHFCYHRFRILFRCNASHLL